MCACVCVGGGGGWHGIIEIVQDYFIVSSEIFNSWLNVYLITINNNTFDFFFFFFFIFFIQGTIVVNTRNVERYLLNKTAEQ